MAFSLILDQPTGWPVDITTFVYSHAWDGLFCTWIVQSTSKQIIVESVDSCTLGLKRGMLLPAYGSVVLRRSSGPILVMLECWSLLVTLSWYLFPRFLKWHTVVGGPSGIKPFVSENCWWVLICSGGRPLQLVLPELLPALLTMNAVDDLMNLITYQVYPLSSHDLFVQSKKLVLRLVKAALYPNFVLASCCSHSFDWHIFF